MTYREAFLNELDREADANRRVLERVPEGKNTWKPHPKSMELGYLATTVANMLGWIDLVINQDGIDFNPPGGEPLKTKVLESRAERIEALDRGLAAARRALENTTEEHLMTNWQMRNAGHVISEQPRHVSIRDGVLQHLAHHRGQLTVYLRLNEAPVPAIYGPSADERPF
jgi:uncharacterized damage-inducible protein DinB